MGSILPSRRPRWKLQKKNTHPYFGRTRRRHASWLRRPSATLLAVALIGIGTLAHSLWREATPARAMTNLTVRVIDGDTLRTRDGRIRLLGIDAPELHQTCRDADNREWACGRTARAQLTAHVSVGPIDCVAHGLDRYGRTLAVCSAGNVADIGQAMVRDGHAMNYFDRYPFVELQARIAGRGLWAGNFERPQDWRRRHPRRVER